jgi:outer membrane receptor for ferrienterochelin and colicins
MKHIVLMSAFLMLSLALAAQTGKVSGQLEDNATGEMIAFANVMIASETIGGSTDINGRFSINKVPSGKQKLVVSVLGYEKQTVPFVIKAGEHIHLGVIKVKANMLGLDEVVISGTLKEMSRLESAVPVEVYNKSFFRAKPTPSVFESLQNVNGVRPQLNCNVCNTGDIHINGLEGPYTMVLIDGMPIVSGLSTVYGLTGIPQSLIERVEVVKGPASTLYGSEAVGGMINIITKQTSAAPKAAVDIFTSGWGEVNTDVGVKYNLGNRVSALLGVNYFNYQNPIDNNNDGFTDLTLQNRISVFNKLNIKRKDNRVFTIAGRYVYEDRWGGEMDWTRADRGGDEVYGESIYTSRWETFGVYQLPTKETVNFQFSANGHSQNSVYGNTIYNADQYIGFGQLTWNKKMNRHDMLLGATYRYTFYDDDTPATFNSETEINQASVTHLPGAFLQDEFSINEFNKILVGVRYDYNTLHGSILTPRVNYKWTSANKKNILRFSAGNGYRVANVFTEDHAALTGARTIEFQGELSPETSWNGNINFVKKFYTKKNAIIGLDATAFYTYFTNRILPDYETDPNKIIYGNLQGSSTSRGTSLNIDVALQNGFKALAGVTLMDVTVEENGDRFRQLLTESVQGVWSVGYTFGKIGLSIDYTGNLYGPMRLPLLGELDDRDEYSPWWSIQNIQMTKSLGKAWEIYAGVKNLLNFTPPANSIARSFDPFDRDVQFDANGQVVPTANNPNALTFDPTYVYAANQGIRGFLGFRYTLN